MVNDTGYVPPMHEKDRPRLPFSWKTAVLTILALALLASPLLIIWASNTEVPENKLPDYQASIVADGEVTFEEYTQAASDTVACIRSNGVKADDPVLEDNRTFSFIVEVPDDGDSAAVDKVVSDCRAEFFSAVQIGWADEISVPAAEEEFNQILVDCLDDGGVDADMDNLLPALEADQQLFDRCTEVARELTRP